MWLSVKATLIHILFYTWLQAFSQSHTDGCIGRQHGFTFLFFYLFIDSNNDV